MEYSGNSYLLIIEDSPEDFVTVKRVLQKIGFGISIQRCKDGNRALALLSDNNSRKPLLILLDLNLPGTDGLEVLKQIKGNSRLASIPVIIFSSSSNSRDVEAAYNGGANSYLRKPQSYSDYVDALTGLKRYWFDLAQLPEGEPR